MRSTWLMVLGMLAGVALAALAVNCLEAPGYLMGISAFLGMKAAKKMAAIESSSEKDELEVIMVLLLCTVIPLAGVNPLPLLLLAVVFSPLGEILKEE